MKIPGKRKGPLRPFAAAAADKPSPDKANRAAPDDVNPNYVKPVREHPEIIRLRLKDYHRETCSMELYYEQYPWDRPPGRAPPEGRSR